MDISAFFGDLANKDKDGKIVPVNELFDTRPIDAMVVVENCKIIYQLQKTMRPDDKHIW